jgi:hypothetical protein
MDGYRDLDLIFGPSGCRPHFWPKWVLVFGGPDPLRCLQLAGSFGPNHFSFWAVLKAMPELFSGLEILGQICFENFS